MWCNSNPAPIISFTTKMLISSAEVLKLLKLWSEIVTTAPQFLQVICFPTYFPRKIRKMVFGGITCFLLRLLLLQQLTTLESKCNFFRVTSLGVILSWWLNEFNLVLRVAAAGIKIEQKGLATKLNSMPIANYMCAWCTWIHFLSTFDNLWKGRPENRTYCCNTVSLKRRLVWKAIG